MKSFGKKSGSGGEMKPFASEAKRPPKLKGRVANDFNPSPARSAVMPPPTSDIKRPVGTKKK